MAKDYFAEEIGNDYFSKEIAGNTFPQLDIIDRAASKAESIRAPQRFQNLKNAMADTGEVAKRMANSALFGVPDFINPNFIPDQSRLSPGTALAADFMGSTIPIESMGAAAKKFMSSLYVPEKIKGLAQDINTISKNAIRGYRQSYSKIFQNNQAVRVAENTLAKIPQALKEEVDLIGKGQFSLEDLWTARAKLQDKITSGFYKNSENLIRNKVGKQEISDAAREIKNIVLNSLPKSDKAAFKTLDNVYSRIKSPLSSLLKTTYSADKQAYLTKPLIGIFKDTERAGEQLALKELSNYVPELKAPLNGIRDYIKREKLKKLAFEGLAVTGGLAGIKTLLK